MIFSVIQHVLKLPEVYVF